MCNNKRKTKNKTRRSRTKTRKPKYLSLSKHIKSSDINMTTTAAAAAVPQLNLFPLHPENLVDDRSFADENVALLFDSESAAGGASLTGLLRPSAASEQEGSPSSYERTYHDSESLVRAAMKRRRNGDGGEEKWVSYSEVTSSSSKEVVWAPEKKKKKKSKKRVETTSSNSEGNSVISVSSSSSSSSLALKLDYQGILKAWSDKGSGSLFIHPQTVPDLQYDHGLTDTWAGSSVGNLWNVPEISAAVQIKEEMEGWKLGQREASVLRYKEKRQSRLFSKRIRYEVRKLNAEKRPRMKGRFVKIS